jgi:hypothetical protein
VPGPDANVSGSEDAASHNGDHSSTIKKHLSAWLQLMWTGDLLPPAASVSIDGQDDQCPTNQITEATFQGCGGPQPTLPKTLQEAYLKLASRPLSIRQPERPHVAK